MMRGFAQFLLGIFFVILFFLGLILGTFRFQLLNYSFWQNTFQKHNIYQNLASVSKNSFESQIGKEGGNTNDIKVLTDLITSENAKDVVDKNLQNFLNFANGATPQINVYLPIEKVPKNLLPKNIAGAKSEMTLTELLTKFNFQDWQNLPLQNLYNIGQPASYFFAGTISFVVFVLILIFLLVENGKRFTSFGITFLLSGGLVFLLINILTNLNVVFSKNLINNPSIILTVMGTVFLPAIPEIIYIWKIIGLIMLALGVCLFFVKKPTYNNSK